MSTEKKFTISNYTEFLNSLNELTEDAKLEYKKYILNKKDIELKYGYLIFDVENKDKNKTLHAIAMADNLGEDYHKSCSYLVRNTQYYPGTMNLYAKMFIIFKTLNKCLVFTHNEDYTILFDYIENKEDGILQCKTLKFVNNSKIVALLYLAYDHYFNAEKQMKKFKSIVDKKFKNLTKYS